MITEIGQIGEAELEEDMQYIRSMTGMSATVLTISEGTVLYSITAISGASHNCLLDNLLSVTVCGIHPQYCQYMDLGEDMACRHLTYTAKKQLRILDLHQYSLLYSSRLYISLLFRTDLLDGVLCRSWMNGPLELILYRNTHQLLQLTADTAPEYSTYQSLDDWTEDIRADEGQMLKSAIIKLYSISL